jgi:hypothetical protein
MRSEIASLLAMHVHVAATRGVGYTLGKIQIAAQPVIYLAIYLCIDLCMCIYIYTHIYYIYIYIFEVSYIYVYIGL